MNQQQQQQQQEDVASTIIVPEASQQSDSNNIPSQQSMNSTTTAQPGNVDNVPMETSSIENNHQPPTIEPGDETFESYEQQENGQENDITGTEENISKINCPEKIILCFDLSSELNEVILRQNQKDRIVFEQLTKSMEIFIKHKLRFNRKHEIAIVTFEKEALWVQDFSNDVSLITDTLHNIRTNPTDPFPQFDMTSLLETIENHVDLPKSSNIPDIPPEYVVRAILIYGRSHSEIPSLSSEAKRIFDQYVSCPFFIFDVLYIHEIPDEKNKCEEIYDAFCKLDESEECFVLEVSTYVAARLYETTAKLLAHPLQRPRQQDTEYRIDQNDSSEDETEPE